MNPDEMHEFVQSVTTDYIQQRSQIVEAMMKRLMPPWAMNAMYSAIESEDDEQFRDVSELIMGLGYCLEYKRLSIEMERVSLIRDGKILGYVDLELKIVK